MYAKMCMNVYVYIYACIFLWIPTLIAVTYDFYTYFCMYICVYICIHICMLESVYIYAYEYLCTCINVYIHKCVDMYMYFRMSFPADFDI